MSSIFPENSGQFKPRFDTPPRREGGARCLSDASFASTAILYERLSAVYDARTISARNFFANEKTAFPPPERRAYALAFTHASAFALVSAARLSPSCLELAPPLA